MFEPTLIRSKSSQKKGATGLYQLSIESNRLINASQISFFPPQEHFENFKGLYLRGGKRYWVIVIKKCDQTLNISP